MVNLFGDEDTPYESLHAVVSLAVKPWFEAFVGTRPGVRDSDSKIGEDIGHVIARESLILVQEFQTQRRSLPSWNSRYFTYNRMSRFRRHTLSSIQLSKKQSILLERLKHG